MKRFFAIISVIVLLCLAAALLGQRQLQEEYVDEMTGQPVFREDLEITAVSFDSSVNNHGIEVVPEEDLHEIVNWLRQFTIGRRFEKEEHLPAGYGSIAVTVTYADGSQQTTATTHIRIDGERYVIERPYAPDALPPLD